jgi:uncharacterized protein
LVQIPEEVLRLILKADNAVLIGSVDAKGVPNISPRFVLGILGNEKMLFADAFRNKTFANLKAWNKVTAAVVDKENMGGYQLKGEAAQVADKDLISQANRRLKQFGISKKPHHVWTLVVNEIYSLKPSTKSKLPMISAYA